MKKLLTAATLSLFILAGCQQPQPEEPITEPEPTIEEEVGTSEEQTASLTIVGPEQTPEETSTEEQPVENPEETPEDPAEEQTSTPDPGANLPLTTYEGELFNVDYPNIYSAEESVRGGARIVSNNNQTQISISFSEEKKMDLYLDQPPTDRVSYEGGEVDLYVNPRGYCDGPGCGPPYIAYGIFGNNGTYFITFYNKTEEDELTIAVLRSFQEKH